ncbi:hypothetical protein AAAB31_09780, partial [Lactobacillus acidophilus]
FICRVFRLNYIEKCDTGFKVFLALLLLFCIVDGFSVFSTKRMVVSGYFKTTVKYEEIDNITIFNVHNQNKRLVMALFRTNNNRAY